MPQSKKMLEKVDPQQPVRRPGRLKVIGGSDGDDFNSILANQAVKTVWLDQSDPQELIERTRQSTLDALLGIGPRDEIEGMLGAQMLGAHNAAMECFRRAMIEDQSIEARRENLNLANKLSRAYTMLVAALDHHRGKGQQKVTVEHVHVYPGGQAIVGAIDRGGRREGETQVETQPEATSATNDPYTSMRCGNPEREPLPIATGPREEPVQDARRRSGERSAPRQSKRA
jgi:hypothetical protein